MLDQNLIATLEQSLTQTREAQRESEKKLNHAELEVDRLRQELAAIEQFAQQTEKAINSLLVSMGSRPKFSDGGAVSHTHIGMDISGDMPAAQRDTTDASRATQSTYLGSNVSMFDRQSRGVPSITNNVTPISHRFNDRTITQACTLLLREANGPLHVNELYNMLVAGGMKFKGNNPTISIAVSLNRNRRFKKVGPGTFDLMIREASQTGTY